MAERLGGSEASGEVIDTRSSGVGWDRMYRLRKHGYTVDNEIWRWYRVCLGGGGSNSVPLLTMKWSLRKG